MIKYFLAFFICFQTHGATKPGNRDESLDLSGVLRVHHKNKKALYKFDYEQNSRINGRLEKAYTLGVRYRFFKNFKAGLYYSLRYGQRHDEDWVAGPWRWEKTNERSESFMGVELIPRALITFLPGAWVGELKTKVERNFHNDQNTLKLRPGLTYFWMDDDGPFMNFYLQYEVYLPLNYGRKDIYQTWLYTGMLYHFSDTFKPGFFLAWYEKTWTHPDDFFNKTTGETFEAKEEGKLLGLTLNFRIP